MTQPMNLSDGQEHDAVARRIRARLVELSHRRRVPHLASALSCVDILVAAYWQAMRLDPQRPGWLDRDRLILSKGHAATALYAVLAERGFFEATILDSLASAGSPLEEHPSCNCVPGVEASTGSLGHGLALGIGMALAAVIQNRSYRVFVVLGDGECNEGSVWEGAMFAAAHRLGHLTVIVDFNKWQATGRSCEVMALEPLREKWAAFGWQAHEVDGHDPQALAARLAAGAPDDPRPRAIVANTVKGRGVSFMEDDNNWHYRIPSADELVRARQELGVA
jgi:transketolase